MTIDKLARKNIELQQTFKKELEEKIDLCAGCDIPSIHLQYAPLRQTLTVAEVPGLVSPTMRGRSVDMWIS